jgi:hypothetical protein
MATLACHDVKNVANPFDKLTAGKLDHGTAHLRLNAKRRLSPEP